MESEAEDVLNSFKSSSERLTIASVYSFYDNYLCPNFKKVIDLEKHTVDIRLEYSREVINSMLAGKRRLGFTHHPCNYTDLISELLFTERLVLVSGKYNERLSAGINVSMIRELDFMHSSFLDRHIEELILDKVQFPLIINIGSKIIDLIRNTSYMTLLPESYAKPELEKGEFFEIPINDYEFPKLEYYCIRNKDIKKLTETEIKIIEFFKK
ncbi:MAG: LysR substrate-binding domain-containing protein [Tissierellia bacterium]|nr:LysR substrate-binding domain-containing protein [Tissierellia bacterium]